MNGALRQRVQIPLMLVKDPSDSTHMSVRTEGDELPRTLRELSTLVKHPTVDVSAPSWTLRNFFGVFFQSRGGVEHGWMFRSYACLLMRYQQLVSVPVCISRQEEIFQSPILGMSLPSLAQLRVFWDL